MKSAICISLESTCISQVDLLVAQKTLTWQPSVRPTPEQVKESLAIAQSKGLAAGNKFLKEATHPQPKPNRSTVIEAILLKEFERANEEGALIAAAEAKKTSGGKRKAEK